MLKGVPRELRWWVAETALKTDRFFPLLQDCFYTYWGDPDTPRRLAVTETLERWAGNVRAALVELVEVTEQSERKRRSLIERIRSIEVKPQARLVEELSACAKQPPEEMTSGSVAVERLPFELLPAGEGELGEIIQSLRRMARMKSGRVKVIDEKRLEMIRSLGPHKCYVGDEQWNGYVLFEFPFTEKVVLECPVEGNATYVLSGDWKTLARLTKKQLRETYPERCERVIHKDKRSWLGRVRDCLSG